jgi:nucleoside-diphosphate-sugar epimerase
MRMASANNPKVIFVTGATGRLGGVMLKALVSSGSEVRALMMTKGETAQLVPGAIPFVGNLSDTRVIEEACDGAEVVFHFASIVYAAKETAEHVMKTNVEGTRHLLEACKKKKVRHLIFTSTVDVYGRKRNGSLNEESQLLPTDKYGHSKMLAEQLIMRSGVPYTIVRMANIYGPGFEHYFFKVFRAVREGKMVIIGNGRNRLAMVNVRDVIKALMLVKNNPQISIGKVYNIGDGAVYTQEGLIDLAADMMKVKRPQRHVSELLARMLAKTRNLDSDELKFLTSDRVIDISRIRKELGFNPEVDINTGGRELVDEFLNRVKIK